MQHSNYYSYISPETLAPTAIPPHVVLMVDLRALLEQEFNNLAVSVQSCVHQGRGTALHTTNGGHRLWA